MSFLASKLWGAEEDPALPGLQPNQGNQGLQRKSENFIFNQGKSRKEERYFEKLEKIREALELLLFPFRVVTISILSHTSS